MNVRKEEKDKHKHKEEEEIITGAKEGIDKREPLSHITIISNITYNHYEIQR